MQGKSRPELYKSFLEFIAQDAQHERTAVNRRMFSMFLWCFIIPAVTAMTLLFLVKIHVLPRSSRYYLDWLILVFPVLYSLYVLSSEVLIQMPLAFRRGGVATSLVQSLHENEWRDRVCLSMKRSIEASLVDWKWMVTSFRIDLDRMRHRTAYLTALAGAVFFLLMQGIDFLGDDPQPVTWVKSPMGLIEAPSNDLSQIVGLTLFLVLFYLSGSQTYHSLIRYLHCAELVAGDLSEDQNKKD